MINIHNHPRRHGGAEELEGGTEEGVMNIRTIRG